MQPHTVIRFLPAPPGQLESLFFISQHKDVYGWYADAEAGRHRAMFFMLENFFSELAPKAYRSVQDDVYGDWVRDQPPYNDKVRCPLPEAMRHELERLQSSFVDEWLFFPSDPRSGMELSSFRERNLPVLGMNVKARRLSRLARASQTWEYATAVPDNAVLDFLEILWPRAPLRARR